MPEVRLIDANALIQNHCGACANKKFCAEESCPYYEIRRRIEATPTIEAEPVRHGRWIEATKHRDENGTILTDYECSECFAMLKYICPEEIEEERFCYNCGALMDLRTPTEVALDIADSVMMGGADNG